MGIYKTIIPKAFELGGMTVNVKHLAHSVEGSTLLGTCDLNRSVINLYETYKSCPVSKDSKESTFCHEVVHAILMTMGKGELSDDEGFVEGFANLLHQYLKTAR